MSLDKLELLSDYLPANAIESILNYQNEYKFRIKITRPRKTKLGDFRVISRNLIQVSVNGNLNKYEFLIVLLHEIAHVIVWKTYNKRVKPHGKEWKNTNLSNDIQIII